MNKISATLAQVLDDDPNNPFWKSLQQHPDYVAYTKTIELLFNQDHKTLNFLDPPQDET